MANRKSLRWKGFDYRGNATFFVTLVTRYRFCWFGSVEDGEMRLNPLGLAVREELLRTPDLRSNAALGEYVIMPNHVHFLVSLQISHGWDHPPGLDTAGRPLVSRSLGALVRGFKGAATRRINEVRRLDEPGSAWQRGYYEHVVRDLGDRRRIEAYIRANPSRWQFDLENDLGSPDDVERSFWRDMDGSEHDDSCDS